MAYTGYPPATPEGWLSDVFTEVTDEFEYNRSRMDQYSTHLEEAILNLQNVLDLNDFVPSVRSMNDIQVDTINAPIKNISQQNFNHNWPDMTVADPVLAPIDINDFGIDIPEDLISADIDFNHSIGDYSSIMWDALQLKIYNNLVTGGTGLTIEAHQAIIDRGNESFRALNDREYRRAMNAAGAHGYNYIENVAVAVQRESLQEILAKETDVINNTIIKDFDVAVDMEKFFVTAGTNLEQFLRSTYLENEKLKFDLAKTSTELLVKINEHNLQLWLGKWNAVKTQLETKKLEIDAKLSINKNSLEVFMASWEGKKAEISAISSENTSKADLMKAEAAIYNAEVSGYGEEIRALVEKAKIKLAIEQSDISSLLDIEKLKGALISDRAKLQSSVANGIATIAAQVVAASIAGNHVSMGYSGRRDSSSSYSSGTKDNHYYKYDCESGAGCK